MADRIDKILSVSEADLRKISKENNLLYQKDDEKSIALANDCGLVYITSKYKDITYRAYLLIEGEFKESRERWEEDMIYDLVRSHYELCTKVAEITFPNLNFQNVLKLYKDRRCAAALDINTTLENPRNRDKYIVTWLSLKEEDQFIGDKVKTIKDIENIITKLDIFTNTNTNIYQSALRYEEGPYPYAEELKGKKFVPVLPQQLKDHLSSP
ncbi:MAG: hypothetical protein JSW73_04500 [Candidatus Woesearchaeota archaeon]|nr:MAG: hypothetical protein JSW73_04500 [Candidatus Woesearchaeota archaeon]